jgi:hypothetical protein
MEENEIKVSGFFHKKKRIKDTDNPLTISASIDNRKFNLTSEHRCNFFLPEMDWKTLKQLSIATCMKPSLLLRQIIHSFLDSCPNPQRMNWNDFIDKLRGSQQEDKQ